MTILTRRLFLAGSAATATAGASAGLANASETGGAATVSLEDALKARKSTRRFATADLPEEQVLRLLWAASGVNRPEDGGLTAPSWHHANDTEVYIARAEGVGRYDPVAATLESVTEEDIRAITSSASFVNRAPAVLIYVSNQEKLIAAAGDIATEAPQELEIAAHVNAAVIAQNVYLFCAAEGLGTCIIGSGDRAAIQEALSFGDDRKVTYIQPVGQPR